MVALRQWFRSQPPHTQYDTPGELKMSIPPAAYTGRRWLAEVAYQDGSASDLYFEEFDELGEQIEAGPDWNEIEEIRIVYRRRRKGQPQEADG
jgi:hypothetical protein